MNEQKYGKFVEGYLGSVGFEGKNSNRSLYGSDLSKAVREELKKEGLSKNVTIATINCNNVIATVGITEDDLLSFEDKYKDSVEMINAAQTKDGIVCAIKYSNRKEYNDINNYYLYCAEDLSIAKETALSILHSRLDSYRKSCFTGRGASINPNRIENEEFLSENTKERLKKIYLVIKSFKYDHSNSMVDYFDTNIYIDVYVKIKNKKWLSI